MTTRIDGVEGLKQSVGSHLGYSEWHEISQQQVDLFADATGDHQWIHVDVERAKNMMPGGKTIAHGYLTLSLIPWLTGGMLRIDGVTRGINYGSNKVRFTNMVPVGSRVRGRQKVLSVAPRGPGMEIISEMTIEIEGQDRPACVAETIGLVFK